MVDLLVEDMAPDEGENDRCHPGYHRRPNYDGRTCGVLAVDNGCDEESLDCELGQYNSHTRELSKELFLSDLDNGVEGPAGPDVIGEIFAIEAALGDWVREEVDEPVDEDAEPNEPEGDDGPEAGTKLSNLQNTSLAEA